MEGSRMHNLDNAQTVLVVDDEPGIVGVMADILTLAGYRVLTAQSGKAALELADREHPDLILLDVSLPGMTGPEFVASYRERIPSTEQAAVIVTTAHANAAQIAAESGAADVLSKPFDIDDLIERVGRTMRSRSVAA